MTKAFIESIYYAFVNNLEGVPIDSLSIGAYIMNDVLCPGFTHAVESEEDGYPLEGTRRICWTPAKPLTMKELSKVLRIWEELRSESE